MQKKVQQVKVHTDESQQNEHKETQHKTPQLKVRTDLRSGLCHLDDYCSSQWVCC